MKKGAFLLTIIVTVFTLAGYVFATGSMQENMGSSVPTRGIPEYVIIPTIETIAEDGTYIPTAPTQTAPHTTVFPDPDATTPTQDPEWEQLRSYYYDRYFDLERAQKPAIADFEKLENHMCTSEVIEILGKPHDFGPTSGVPSLLWEAEDGTEYIFVFFPIDNNDDRLNIFQIIFEYGYIIIPD